MKTLIKNNKLITEFMEWTLDDKDLNSYRKYNGSTFKYSLLSNFKYHTDWNWLMPVVEKIQSMGYWVDYTKGDVFIYDDEYNLVIPNPMHENKDTKLSIHYKIVIEFINWYNNKQ